MRFHNGFCCFAASLFAIATLAVASFGRAVALQPAISLPHDAPNPAAAMAGYRAADGWVRSWKAPAQATAGLATLTGGAHVQLRLDGVLVGRGQAFPAPGEPGGTALLRATREAMQAAEAKLQLPNDAMRDAALKEQASRIMISLDLAGPLIAFGPSTWAEAEMTLSPGLEGVATAVRGGDGLSGMLASAFPSLLISTNTLPHRALGGLCAQTIGEGGAAAALEQPKLIRERHGIRMYRFRTTHLAQCKPGAEPVFLYRGARLVDQSEMTAAELRRMAEEMATHLVSHLKGANATESLETSALAAVALRRYGATRRAFAGGPPNETDREAWSIIAESTAKIAPTQTAAAAMLLLAESSPFGQPPPEMCGIHADEQWRVLSNVLNVSRGSPEALLGAVPGPIKAPVAMCFAVDPSLVMTMPADGNNRSAIEIVEKAVREVISETPQGQLVAHMPWLGWAEIELARHKAAVGGQPADIPSATALREMRSQVWEHQVGATDIDKDSMDLAGGIVFTKGTSPLPTWQCTRPLAFIATMLRDERLTEPRERALELARLFQSLRFLRQLQADDSIGWMAANPDRAIGGVRVAPWDQSMPPDATSMALLTVVEAIRSLDALSKPAAAALMAVPPAAEVPLANP